MFLFSKKEEFLEVQFSLPYDTIKTNGFARYVVVVWCLEVRKGGPFLVSSGGFVVIANILLFAS